MVALLKYSSTTIDSHRRWLAHRDTHIQHTMGDPARDSETDRPSASKAPATDSEPTEPTEAKVAEPRKPVTEDAPNIEEQDPPLEATDSEDVYDDDDDMEDTDEYSAASVTVRSSIWEHEFEGGRRVRMVVLFTRV